MKKIICSYGNEPYYKQLDLLEKSAYQTGKIDKFYKYTRKWLETTEFYKKNQYILDKPRGSGNWLWKTKIILDTFDLIDTDDIVMYSDAAIEIIGDLQPLYDITSKSNRMVFTIPGNHLNKVWTKKDCFVLTGCDKPEYHNSYQVNGAISLWKKTLENIDFLLEWQKLMRDPRIITDDPNFCGQNYPEFRDHRHDQSILSLLSIKYKFEQYRDPTQYGNEDLLKFTNLLNYLRM